MESLDWTKVRRWHSSLNRRTTRLMMPTHYSHGRGVAIVRLSSDDLPEGQSMLKSIVAICVGASCGALLRWALGMQLNALFPDIPPGTLVANLLGAYVIGVAIAFFAASPTLSPEWRLLIITGFCGGLTTFSTYSAELVNLLQQGRVAMAGIAAAAHLSGSLLMTIAGFATVGVIRHWR